jgi:hypothetical protein
MRRIVFSKAESRLGDKQASASSMAPAVGSFRTVWKCRIASRNLELSE